MRSNKSKVKLIRVNKDGTITLNKFNINLNKKYLSESNPLLQDGDTVIVGRASIAQLNDFLGAISIPFQSYDAIRKILGLGL